MGALVVVSIPLFVKVVKFTKKYGEPLERENVERDVGVRFIVD